MGPPGVAVAGLVVPRRAPMTVASGPVLPAVFAAVPKAPSAGVMPLACSAL